MTPYFYIVPPADGVWDFEFYATPPSGVAIQIISTIDGTFRIEDVDLANYWGQGLPLTGVRVHGFTNSIEARLADKVEAISLL